MYLCQFCKRGFTAKHACTQHEKYHCEANPNRVAVKQTKFYTEHKKTTCRICGKLFDVANISRHEASCGKPDSQYHVSHEGLDCIFCGKTCKNKNSLAQHEIRCRENPERKSWDCLAKFIEQEAEALRNSGGPSKETCARVARAANTLSQRHKMGELTSCQKGKPGAFLGRTHTEESKAKIRISTLKYLEDTVGLIQPRYNINACAYINILNDRFNWQLQHAENGGERYVCGYFLDGYDNNLNIAFEYDEPRHYTDVAQNVLCERDIVRMRSIIKELGCRFIRYNEKLDLLYEVNSELSWQQI